MFVIAGDIGGTNTRLLIAEVTATSCVSMFEKSYLSQDFHSLTDVLNTFLKEYDINATVDAACFAVAGPVINKTVSVTNLPWIISEEELQKHLNTPDVTLINDFIAVAHGITELKDPDFIVLQQGQIPGNKKHPDCVVIGAGTGLGAAHIVYLDERYHYFSSEAGHSGFSPVNKIQTNLLSWMQVKHEHVSLEMILSGNGLVNIYNFFKDFIGIKESETVKNEMKIKNPSQVITEYAQSVKDELCIEALTCFVNIYGAASGDIALHYYPVDEVYIAGGIAPKIKDEIAYSDFIHYFINKGLLTSNMKKITVKLILQDKVGLYGALSLLKSTLSLLPQ